MNYHVTTFGCQMNEADSQRLASEMEKLGLDAAPSWEKADVLVLNTCVVRQGAEDKAWSYLHMLKPFKQQNPNLVVGVMGCLVGVRGNSPLKQTFPWVDVFMAPSEPAPMVDFLLQKEARRMGEVETRERFALQNGDVVETRHGASLQTQWVFADRFTAIYFFMRTRAACAPSSPARLRMPHPPKSPAAFRH
jgi:tRNA-2-methylthio-N6-dimethylallyladenosine synthase